jgi:hypothetical protein
MARLVALIPRPYHPLIRFHGLFAPHCSWRSKVVARSADDCRHGQRACSASAGPRAADPCPLSVEFRLFVGIHCRSRVGGLLSYYYGEAA